MKRQEISHFSKFTQNNLGSVLILQFIYSFVFPLSAYSSYSGAIVVKVKVQQYTSNKLTLLIKRNLDIKHHMVFKAPMCNWYLSIFCKFKRNYELLHPFCQIASLEGSPHVLINLQCFHDGGLGQHNFVLVLALKIQQLSFWIVSFTHQENSGSP